MGFVGPEFTWSRQLGARGWVRERLDRALVSTNWASLFPGLRLYNVATCSSDHNILILKTLPTKSRNKKRQRLFKFEAMWIKDEECEAVVKEAWEKGRILGDQNQFGRCMDECRSSLQSWNRTNFGHVDRKIASLSKKLQCLECLPRGKANMEEIHDTKGELNRMLSAKEEMWKQRLRNCWLKSRDSNTSFFHEKASKRHQRNTITRLLDSNGNWQDKEDIMGHILVEYFQELFTSSNPTVSEELLDAVHPKVTNRMNEVLLQDFRIAKVEKALKQMHPLKAPGPDGMPPLFFQHYWPTVNSIVIQTVIDFLNHCVTPPKFHETHIVLIPKTKNPSRVTDYRPISLCNVAYKLASKVVANQMRVVLKDIVCENQSAFVADRLITDNILVAHELMNHIHRKRKGRVGEMVLKLDMSKACDRVEWGCLQKIMEKLGFHERWIRIVMACVSSVTYAIRF